jgi:ABC-2 type transport system ATP-binding protein
LGMNVMRDVMVDLSRRGATIVLSSHQMDTVEKLCDRVALINKGEKVLDGAVSEVKARYGQNTLVLAFDGDGAFLASLPGVAKVSDFGKYVEIRMDDGADPQTILSEAAARLRVRRFEIVEPSLHDIFVETVTDHGKEATS